MYERMRNLREDKDLKQKDIAKMLNVAQTTYSDYENGKINMPTSILIKLAELYNTSIDYLLGMTDTREANVGEVNSDILSCFSAHYHNFRWAALEYAVFKNIAFYPAALAIKQKRRRNFMRCRSIF